eukprot:gene5911-6841_t
MTDRFLQVIRNIVLSREIFGQVKAIHTKLGVKRHTLKSITYQFIKQNNYHQLCLYLLRLRGKSFAYTAAIRDFQDLYNHGKLVNLAACTGSLEIIEYLESQGISSIKLVEFNMVAFNGHTCVFQHYNKHPELKSSLSNGHEHSYSTITPNTLMQAARGGKLDLIRWLHLNRTEGGSSETLQYAIQSCNLDVVRYVYENNIGDNNKSIARIFIKSAVLSIAPDNIYSYLFDQVSRNNLIDSKTISKLASLSTNANQQYFTTLLDQISSLMALLSIESSIPKLSFSTIKAQSV